jgi:hypothetical protein
MSATIVRPARPPLDAWKTDLAWQDRLEQDLTRAESYQTTAQRHITETLLARARDLNAEAFALTGSMARHHRTAISDLDYHVIGPRPRSDDLADEIDIVAVDAIGFCRKLRAGDDYAQWTLRYGCILFDRTGIFRSGLRLLDEARLWPDTSRKHARLPAHKLHADRLISLGDRDAAQEQVRAALTSAARATLLDAHIFPLSRDELPQQLRDIGRTTLADALQSSIHAVLSLAQLARRLSAIDEVISDGNRCASREERHVVSNEAGGWDVVHPGSRQVSSRYRTQREAVSRAREVVRESGGGEVVVHARDGRIRNRDTIGRPAL